MFVKLLNKIFGRNRDRTLRRMKDVVNTINQKEPYMEKLNNKQLASKTEEFRSRMEDGETLNSLLPEAFAVVREVSKRIFGMRHFDVQLLGGIVLNNRCVAEMQTGEGKTLTATLPAYLNALRGEGVHVVTVNDYLARRDAENNSPLFEFLGMNVGVNLSGLSASDKRAAYAADITYGTNHEYGFDYLRDNMTLFPEERVQRKLYYALVDEVDSILIDEARTPLIISGPTEESSEIYRKINTLIPHLVQQEQEDSESFQGSGHFYVDEKCRQVNLTERGLVRIEELLVKMGIITKGELLYSPDNITLIQHINAALRAHVIFHRDVDYIVKDGKVIIVDEHTGRTMPGRRWSEGLHQAVEAKEKVGIQNENQTLAVITFQNYFRLYEKLAGMTGTAETEAFELRTIYNLDTIVIPTNRPMIRKDFPDRVYRTEKEKMDAIIKEVTYCTKRGQPVLVGTISIDKSDKLSKALHRKGIAHKVLNAKFHAKEAEIIAQAGKPGAVTIATNMAGRGTDIVLGGSLQSEQHRKRSLDDKSILTINTNWQQHHSMVISAGGLHVIGTERHESRRIDNQLRGRAGRQGDAGSSRFYLSMEDDLMRIFSSERISGMLCKIGMKPGEAIEHPLITKAIANAQRKVESRNFYIRKQLLEYDDVANDQRCAIYAQRNELLNMSDMSETINSIRKEVLMGIFDTYIPPKSLEETWQILNIERCLKESFDVDVPIRQWLDNEPDLKIENIYDRVLNNMLMRYRSKEKVIKREIMRKIEKSVMLKTLDYFWREHLAAMDYLRQGIHLRGYAQKDPKQEYKRESFSMFTTMLDSFKYEVIRTLSKSQICTSQGELVEQHQVTHRRVYDFSPTPIKQHEVGKKMVGRNEPCPCGSYKKFKYCHGKES